MPVRTINYKGKAYVQVVDRVQEVHNRHVAFEVLDSIFFEIKGRVLCKATIKVDGKQYTGNAEVKLENAQPKSADATNPFECGETSAVGRALAWAGFGTVDGIASFDEIARSMDQDEVEKLLADQPRAANNTRQSAATNQRQQPPASANNRPATAAPVGDQQATAKAVLLKQIADLKPTSSKTGKVLTTTQVLAYVFSSQIQGKKTTVEQLVNKPEYTEEEQLLLQDFIDSVKTQREAAKQQQQPAA